MKAEATNFDTQDSCPDCGETTSVVKLGSEPAREICGRFGCEWDGLTLEGPARETNDGVVVIE